ncbi:ATP-dependent helicase [Gordonibacter urolithinfaciens]|uniref:ATP-dependent helicase n=1 Tax=Gordonibacter urolithinfaciens TaxID=1335613 RepID=UPI000F4CA50E|nr:UvrD-helicase domain-containing protein [Gordonibacter urolithinfaciens]MBS6976170.1 UvrD-helicase domain-containing protein [Eggerthellaceae bacterium]MCB6561117.1 UvrD-helicase domain-containing protein [Gordonibacter urolithinfaciens]ROT90913.1 DNA helicase UvrD [Gordonibacter urolithinfaciens]
MPIDIETLNGPQREAVVTIDGPLLVLAGAGSGKTRVLTYRIANLIENHGVAPWEILAITFTNKAAAEMRERLNALVGPRCRGMWVSTFHSMCVRILRADAEKLGFTRNFTIYDTDDQKRLYKEIMAEFDIDPKRFPVNALMNRISTAKNELVVPGNFEKQASDPVGKVAARVYARLQERLRAANAFDFDDLLLYAYLLLKNHEDVRAAYQQRFRYLMVDEYQDTNHAQYAITQLLAEGHKNIMVVGDDDQSIYSWRGADLRNILEFEQDYPNAHVVKLEQNYRSVGNVLAAANAVIANNQHRKQKKLFTASEDGEKINVYLASDERDEGRWIAGEIEKQRSAGLSYNQMAVFYRTNAQSRMLEDMLLRAGVPYRIVGGTRFFDRAEIRDVMAYLTLIVNPADDIAAKRVVNVPRRGIGKTTIERIEQFGREMDMPFIEAAELAIVDPALRASTRQSVASFVGLINEARTYGGDLRKVIEAVIDKSGLIGALQAENTDEARGRIENIQEFLGVVDEFVDTHDDEDADYAAPTAEGDDEAADAAPARVLRGDSLADFIEWVRLRTDLDTVAEDGNAVTLMTVHSSKGLEFDCVFVAGMEETLFPHMNSVGDAASVEEERRLAYVAITRARKRLFLTCASQRQIFGQTSANPVSRFIQEIPAELRQSSGVGSAGFSGTGWEKRGSRRGIAGSGAEAGEGRVFGRSSASGSAGRSDRRAEAYARPDAGKKAAAKMAFAAGDSVDHKTFGRGKVTKVDGDTLYVKFAKSGQTKKLLKDYAPIVKIGA